MSPTGSQKQTERKEKDLKSRTDAGTTGNHRRPTSGSFDTNFPVHPLIFHENSSEHTRAQSIPGIRLP